MIAEGAHIAIVGNRGIGKFSLARQLIGMAEGNQDLLNKLEIGHDERLDFLTIYLACGGQINRYDQLLARLLTSHDCLHDWIYDIPVARKELEALKPKIGAGIFELGGEKSGGTEYTPAVTKHDMESVFRKRAFGPRRKRSRCEWHPDYCG